jgi:hypothetical protein
MWLRGDRIPSDRNNFDRIRQSLCRIPFSRIPTKSASESDKNSVGSDRFFMKNVGFRWNPMWIRSKTTGSAGRIDSPGYHWAWNLMLTRRFIFIDFLQHKEIKWNGINYDIWTKEKYIVFIMEKICFVVGWYMFIARSGKSTHSDFIRWEMNV